MHPQINKYGLKSVNHVGLYA